MSKEPQTTDDKPTQTPTPPAPAAQKKEKKKISLDISDVSEVLERKISP